MDPISWKLGLFGPVTRVQDFFEKIQYPWIISYIKLKLHTKFQKDFMNGFRDIWYFNHNRAWFHENWVFSVPDLQNEIFLRKFSTVTLFPLLTCNFILNFRKILWTVFEIYDIFTIFGPNFMKIGSFRSRFSRTRFFWENSVSPHYFFY